MFVIREVFWFIYGVSWGFIGIVLMVGFCIWIGDWFWIFCGRILVWSFIVEIIFGIFCSGGMLWICGIFWIYCVVFIIGDILELSRFWLIRILVLLISDSK